MSWLYRISCCAGLAAGLMWAADPYRPGGFLQFPDSVKMGALSSVAVAADGHIYILHRGTPPLLEFDANRRYVRGWGEGLFKVAHGLRIDRNGNIWTTDNGNHVVRKFSANGELLLTLGETDKGGAGKDHFRSPDDIVIDSHGTMFVADSGNGRIVHLDASGAYLSEWGAKGDAPGQFKMAHGLAIDARDRIYVADRGNNRVQVFTPDGKLVAVWSGFGNPYGLLIAGKKLLVSEGEVHKIFHLDLDGKITASWGGPSVLQLPHFMALDRNGNLLVAEVNGQRVQIFTRGNHGI
jgi:sugar lactone lactonase YvrE